MTANSLAGDSLLSQVVIVLVSTRNPLNIGAVARAMSNFGFRRLRVVNPYPLAFREAKSAVGAAALLTDAEEHKSIAESVADCSLVVGTTAARKRKLDHDLRPLNESGRAFRRAIQSGKVALLFGSEKRGLSNEDLSHCHWLMRIPTAESNPSMNLGQAVAVCLYELARPSGPVAKTKKPVANAADLDRLTAILMDTLRLSGYTAPVAASATDEKLRRLVRRLDLSVEDAQVWLGMLRQVLWKIRSRS
jgi:TrmH family RNA methyltransferase